MSDGFKKPNLAKLTILASILLVLAMVLVQPFKILKQYQQAKKPLDSFTEPLELPDRLKAPAHKNEKIIVFEDKALDTPISWSAIPGAQRYLVEIYLDDSLEEKLHTEIVSSTKYPWPQIFAGRYYYRVRGIDKFERLGNPSVLLSYDILPRVEETEKFIEESQLAYMEQEPEVGVDEALNKIQQRRETARKIRVAQKIARQKTLQAQLKEQQRRLKQQQTQANKKAREVANTVPKLPTTLGQFTVLNKDLSNTLSLAIGTEAYSVQTDSGNISPTATTVRLSYSKKRNPHVYDGLIKVGVLKLNSKNSTQWSIEGQYAYTLFNIENLEQQPEALSQQVTLQAVAGLEVSNPASSSLLGQRELAKAGARANYNGTNNIKLGAEALYGVGVASSLSQSELSVNAQYKINSKYDIGLGFKDKRLTSKDSKLNPSNSTKYNEDSQETFGTFQYNF